MERRQQQVEEQRRKQEEERRAREAFDMKAEDEYRKVMEEQRASSRSLRPHDRRRQREAEKRREREASTDPEDPETGLNGKEKQAIRVCFRIWFCVQVFYQRKNTNICHHFTGTLLWRRTKEEKDSSHERTKIRIRLGRCRGYVSRLQSFVCQPAQCANVWTWIYRWS